MASAGGAKEPDLAPGAATPLEASGSGPAPLREPDLAPEGSGVPGAAREGPVLEAPGGAAVSREGPLASGSMARAAGFKVLQPEPAAIPAVRAWASSQLLILLMAEGLCKHRHLALVSAAGVASKAPKHCKAAILICGCQAAYCMI